MSSSSISATMLFVLSSVVPIAMASTVETTPANPLEEREVALRDAQAEVEALEKLVSQVRNPALSEPMDQAVRNLKASLEVLSGPDEPGRVAIPTQRAPVAFQPPIVDVRVGVPGSVHPPISIGVEVPIEAPTAEEVLRGHEMSDGDVQTLLNAMAEEGFPDSRLALLRLAVMDAQVTVDQVLSLVGAFDFGSDKVEAAALLHSRVSDPEHFYKVYGTLDFESDKEALRRRIQ